MRTLVVAVNIGGQSRSARDVIRDCRLPIGGIIHICRIDRRAGAADGSRLGRDLVVRLIARDDLRAGRAAVGGRDRGQVARLRRTGRS